MKMTQRRMARPSLGGMLATRQGALVLALICAACAAGILMFALGQYKTGLKTPTVQATVLVATAQIPKGTAGEAVATRGLYKSTPIVASQLAPGAISDASLLTGKVASVNILPGQQLTATDFAGVNGVSGLLTPNQRAVALSIAESPGATDLLQPGDRVDVYETVKPGVTPLILMAQNIQVVKQSGGTLSAAPAGAAPAASAGSASSTGTGSSSTPSAGAAASPATAAGSSLVLAVTDKQASDLVWAAESATVYLTVRPPNASGSARIVTDSASVVADALATSTPTLNGGH
ncbi:MAG: Flp pilus assembly protein CpaB [Solirubrobacteraceae bacterium]